MVLGLVSIFEFLTVQTTTFRASQLVAEHANKLRGQFELIVATLRHTDSLYSLDACKWH